MILRSTRSAALAVLAWVMLAAPVRADDRFVRYEGRAVDLEAGTPVYDERHFVRLRADKVVERVVLYLCPGTAEQAFARKRMEVGPDPLRPSFEMRDARLGYAEGLRENAGQLEVFYQRDRASAEERETLVLPPELVADAGFDEFVRKHWDELLRGDKVAFDFLVPSRLEYLSFKVRHLREEKEAGRDAQVFRLSLSGVLGWFLDGIDVWYATDDRSLLRFDGLSNVRNAEGDNYTARILFPADLKREEADGSAQAAALALPLVERCP